jgi:uncharacterized membrane protein YphA (DoxX/SURF4 family)
MKARLIIYWITTALVAFSMGSGGLTELARVPAVVEGMLHVLGYPPYFLTILGFWKVLGTIAILIPGYPRLKEWAYAGIFFDFTGAAASNAAAGDYGQYAFHIIAPLIGAVLALVSWGLRPASRTLGVLFRPRAEGS